MTLGKLWSYPRETLAPKAEPQGKFEGHGGEHAGGGNVLQIAVFSVWVVVSVLPLVSLSFAVALPLPLPKTIPKGNFGHTPG